MFADGDGNRVRHSIQSYLDAYYSLVEILRDDPDDVPAQMMLRRLDPARVKHFEAVCKRASAFAENQLKTGMFRSSTGNFTQIAANLMDTKRWLTHGQMIGWQDAEQIGLQVEYLNPKDPVWQAYWQLYCLQRLAVGDRQKLFESDYASLPLDSSIA